MLEAIVGVLSYGVRSLRDRARAITGCPHPHAAHAEGKSICPDCGESVIRRWVALRCSHCQTRRASRMLFNVVTPVQAHCTRCGCADTTVETFDSPPYYLLQFAVLATLSEADALRQVHRAERTRAWVSPNEAAAGQAATRRLCLPLARHS